MMKTSHPPSRWPFAPRGFVLPDLLVAGSIAVLLVAMAVGAVRYSEEVTRHLLACRMHATILSGLEQYFAEHQTYPVPAQPQLAARYGEKDFPIGGAAAVYQALHHDGSDLLNRADAVKTPSDGKVDPGPDGLEISWLDYDPSVFGPMVQKAGDHYVLVDPYGRPFQYEIAVPGKTVNQTFDCWSFGTAADEDTGNDLARKSDTVRTARWLKNWGQAIEEPGAPATR